MKTLETLLSAHPFFQGLSPEHIAYVAGCGRNVFFREGILFREGEPANDFFLLREGKVSIEIASPRFGPISVETAHAGDVVGWSWLFPPYQWHFDARVVEPVRATALDGKCLRDKCEREPALGYALMKLFAAVMLERLQAARRALVESHELARGA